jgi:D-alanyl-lipoteichoic acid acyltransferase DltB (MBOAT superfamily)
MLFNSQLFIFAFLPITVIGFGLIREHYGAHAARYWLLLASLVFYGWWSIGYLVLLVLWTVGNFVAGRQILSARHFDTEKAKRILLAAVAVNLCLLAYFKYSMFIVDNAAALLGLDFVIGAVVLPLGISFHTFQQIAYLSDVYRGSVPRYTLSDYVLFVTFFPQLIAGPIVHHSELTPQFRDAEHFRLTHRNFAFGIAFFTIGLLKKLVLADPLSAIATPLFKVHASISPTFLDAWIATIAFGLGLYFDFSAYSDMAIGLARMFGIRLPYNFASPYQSSSIIEFWRRWHMTLSRWLRDYLYVSLGGNRKGPFRRYANLMITMLLGGLWHGAAWTFVVWGAIHGTLLMINHAWNHIVARSRANGRDLKLPTGVARFLTLLSVSVAWVFFASASWQIAIDTLCSLAGLNGIHVEGSFLGFFKDALTRENKILVCLAVGIALFAPNSQQLIEGQMFDPGEQRVYARLHFSFTLGNAVIVATFFAVCLTLLGTPREFVYFQF